MGAYIKYMSETKEQRKARAIRNKERERKQHEDFLNKNPGYSKEMYEKHKDYYQKYYQEHEGLKYK
jgi:hypothetical protein